MLKEMKNIKSNEDGILAKLFRKVIIETGFINSINYFINRYNGKKSRATISRLILDGEMTWNSFTFLIITILKAKSIELLVSINKYGKTFSSSIVIKQNDYNEKKSGIYLKKSYVTMVEKLGDNFNLKSSLVTYYKNGGGKNKATISKILDSELISWKSYMFLMFELLDNSKLTLKLKIHNVHGKKSTHELVITKSKG